MPRVVATSRSFVRTQGPADFLRAKGYDVHSEAYSAAMGSEGLQRLMASADALLPGAEPVTAAMIAAALHLKIIARVGVGYDAVDLEAATKRGIWVTNTPGANKEAVADLTFGLMLSVARRIPKAHQAMRDDRWEAPLGVWVYSKTIGIVGTGNIGKAVARRARGFDMRVLAYDVVRDDGFAAQHGVAYVSLEELFRESDFITLHVPYSSENHHLIDERAIDLMKSSAFVVNAARGGLIDEAALYRALTSGRLAGAALDCHENEPRRDYDLARLENVVATPHMAGQAAESIELSSLHAAECIAAVCEGGAPPADRVVNRELLAARA
ncbi:MAG: phosphoglycerate dehydrogenase [Chloroflexi bacterium]|nr:phosphoglycerate dehydrogenase [Chloroflexota bacterium]